MLIVKMEDSIHEKKEPRKEDKGKRKEMNRERQDESGEEEANSEPVRKKNRKWVEQKKGKKSGEKKKPATSQRKKLMRLAQGGGDETDDNEQLQHTLRRTVTDRSKDTDEDTGGAGSQGRASTDNRPHDDDHAEQLPVEEDPSSRGGRQDAEPAGEEGLEQPGAHQDVRSESPWSLPSTLDYLSLKAVDLVAEMKRRDVVLEKGVKRVKANYAEALRDADAEGNRGNGAQGAGRRNGTGMGKATGKSVVKRRGPAKKQARDGTVPRRVNYPRKTKKL